jgi:glycosyltransferase involved in cell wall biosynthesis
MGVQSLSVVWYTHSRRAETLAAELGGHICFQYESALKKPWLLPLRYLVQGWKTWLLLEQERPEVVLVQSPPIFAPLVVAAWCSLRGRSGHAKRRVPYIIDCLTGTFHDRPWRWALPVLRFLSRYAALSLVTDEVAMHTLQEWNVRSLFMEDALPTLSPPVGIIGKTGEKRVAVISTFSEDEPLAEIFEAARFLSEVTFYVTGDPPGQIPASILEQKPENVILTGFLQGGDYTGLLKNVHGLVILTKKVHAVNCGAYEALALAKPAIVSDWPEMRRTFTQGFIYVTNTPEAIIMGVKKMLTEQGTLADELISMRAEQAARRQPSFEELTALLRYYTAT